MRTLFWICLLCSAYAYFGYPLVLTVAIFFRRLLRRGKAKQQSNSSLPSVTILIPVHNEANIITKKIENSLLLDYPAALQIVIVSDGSTDETIKLIESLEGKSKLHIVELKERRGKAQALNAGLQVAEGEIIVFSDASIMLDRQAICQIVLPFDDATIGCVSGEDHIEGAAGEGLYGKYELYLRNLESEIGSIVGASGSIYAQRRTLVGEFVEGLAPDFLSVLDTVEKGYRAVSVSSAFGYMTALPSTKDEFHRKVRTVVRGMTALFRRANLLNPYRFPAFSFCLLSHKLMRWCVPIFLMGMLTSSMLMLNIMFYRFIFGAQLAFYGIAAIASFDVKIVANNSFGRIALYFVTANIAILLSWIFYFSGVRHEVWTPSKRIRNSDT